MKKSLTFIAQSPISRNNFIDCVNKKENVIVLNNSLWNELREEIDNIILYSTKLVEWSAEENFLSLFNPLFLACNIFFKSLDAISHALYDFKKYNIYLGTDFEGKEIIVFYNKKRVEKWRDIISYPSFVKSIDDKLYTEIIKERMLKQSESKQNESATSNQHNK